MTQYLKQHGSSTAGLLTVIAIFIALLAYVNFYGFKKSTTEVVENESASQQYSSLTKSNPVAAAKEITTIQQSVSPVENSENRLTVDAQDNIAVEPVALANPEQSTVEHNFNEVLPVVTAVTDDSRVQQQFYDNKQLQTALNNQYYHYANTNTRGYGRINETLRGDGEFNFNMKFTSRARMNADSEMNSQLQNANSYYANQRIYLQNLQQNGMQSNFQ